MRRPCSWSSQTPERSPTHQAKQNLPEGRSSKYTSNIGTVNTQFYLFQPSRVPFASCYGDIRCQGKGFYELKRNLIWNTGSLQSLTPRYTNTSPPTQRARTEHRGCLGPVGRGRGTASLPSGPSRLRSLLSSRCPAGMVKGSHATGHKPREQGPGSENPHAPQSLLNHVWNTDA